ncbi:MAG TPA: KGG domain-containing protein [Flavisolibacter sp.]|nr:KGG domain-containing protein [Flavisolibacter sp.]
MNHQETSRDGNDSGTERQRSSNRGFAAMDPEKQKQIASEGGRAAHKQGVAHEWSAEEARQAGRKGGQTVSRNREHMSEIGRRGGQSSGSRRGQRNGNSEA